MSIAPVRNVDAVRILNLVRAVWDKAAGILPELARQPFPDSEAVGGHPEVEDILDAALLALEQTHNALCAASMAGAYDADAVGFLYSILHAVHADQHRLLFGSLHDANGGTLTMLREIVGMHMGRLHCQPHGPINLLDQHARIGGVHTLAPESMPDIDYSDLYNRAKALTQHLELVPVEAPEAWAHYRETARLAARVAEFDCGKLCEQSSLIEDVARALLDEDLPNVGACWPWPDGDADWEVEARVEMRAAAEVAVKAVDAYLWRR